ncbi:type IV pilus biogenesis protein PilM [Desulfovibrio legallii]|uniref:PilM protein n=1 Tax=Desulfovibrio legallii TaxID=571438 RepID=A0A1G7K8L0_9BACT|nr:type IV pilus biogenesis protein PilM [Desulfovibrio legallii]SDF33648.1 PilM protein [Desulfovibrio legallii]
MKIFAVLALLLGVLAVLSAPAGRRDGYSPEVRAIALNYAIYRNAAFLYVHRNNPPDGTVSQTALDLPDGWRALRSWAARVNGGRCYVYGSASAEEIAAVRELFRGSLAVGRAENGRLTPDGLTPLPAFIPADSLVSVVAVR